MRNPSVYAFEFFPLLCLLFLESRSQRPDASILALASPIPVVTKVNVTGGLQQPFFNYLRRIETVNPRSGTLLRHILSSAVTFCVVCSHMKGTGLTRAPRIY